MSIENGYWDAVLARDGRYEGRFVYAVKSTGIYCRPTCPSRRPRREHVVFFADPEAAERAEFRPCLRCRPRESSPEAVLVGRACKVIEAQLDAPIGLSALGTAVGSSPYHLQRTFKRVLGVTPRQYAESLRLDRLKGRLQDGEAVASALYDVGFGSSSRLYEHAPAQLGMTPAVYRRGGAGMSISYAIVDSPLGRMLVGATMRGVCAVSLGDDDANLEAALVREYPAASIQRDDYGLGAWVDLLLSYLRGERADLDMPLDVQGTAFRCKVRELLRAIPYGSTRSYSEMARELGMPSAARAVARACAANPVALVVPCHRVIREDGSLGGYRWGLERKSILLDQERRIAGAGSGMHDAGVREERAV